MFETRHVQWWNQCPSVFYIERRFGINTVLGEKLVDGCAEEFVIDKYVERNAVFIPAM